MISKGDIPLIVEYLLLNGLSSLKLYSTRPLVSRRG